MQGQFQGGTHSIWILIFFNICKTTHVIASSRHSRASLHVSFFVRSVCRNEHIGGTDRAGGPVAIDFFSVVVVIVVVVVVGVVVVVDVVVVVVLVVVVLVVVVVVVGAAVVSGFAPCSKL